ncbi:MAG: hypothetical protein RL414_594, partial [Actinomycetota bacterium]
AVVTLPVSGAGIASCLDVRTICTPGLARKEGYLHD